MSSQDNRPMSAGREFSLIYAGSSREGRPFVCEKGRPFNYARVGTTPPDAPHNPHFPGGRKGARRIGLSRRSAKQPQAEKSFTCQRAARRASACLAHIKTEVRDGDFHCAFKRSKRCICMNKFARRGKCGDVHALAKKAGSSRLKGQSDPIIAITQAGRGRSVVEHVALMTAAARAMILRTRDDQFKIRLFAQCFRQRVEK